MNLSPAAASLAVSLLLGALSACDREQSSESTSGSTEPEMTQPAPDDSTYTGAAGRKEDGPAADESAGADSQQDQPTAPQQ